VTPVTLVVGKKLVVVSVRLPTTADLGLLAVPGHRQESKIAE